MSRLNFSTTLRSVPKDPREYATKEFWAAFHQNETKFEWYGSIMDHMALLDKGILKPSHEILNVGCGTSKLEFDLVACGYPKVHSIDIDPAVIKKKQVLRTAFPQLRYDCASVEAIPAQDGAYDVILDKGTLDALLPMPDMDADAHKLVDKMLDECFRVLKTKGHYVIISLAQKQVVDKLYEYSQKHLDVIVRITGNETVANASYFPTVIIDMMKLSFPLPKQMEWRLAEAVNAPSHSRKIDEVLAFLAGHHNLSRFGNMCRHRLDHIATITISLINEKEQGVDAKISIVDSPRDGKHLKRNAFVIVPPDSEKEKYNRSAEHYQQIPTFMNVDRVILCEFPFDDDDHAREYIDSFSKRFVSTEADDATAICKMAPEEHQVELMSGHGSIVGDFIITQCTIANTTYRRLFFNTSPNIIQSECIIEEGENNEANLMNPKKLCANYQLAMIAAFELAPGGFLNLLKQSPRIAVLGVGGGSLVTFLHSVLTHAKVTCVEIEPALYDIARSHFGLPVDDDRLKSVVMDAMDWINDPNSGEFEFIFLDISGPQQIVDGKEAFYGPPQEFVKNNVLEKYKQHLSSRGCLIMNIISSSHDYCTNIVANVSTFFKYVYEAAVFEGANCANFILFASNEKPVRLNDRFVSKVPEVFKPMLDHRSLFKRHDRILPERPKLQKKKKKPNRNLTFPADNGELDFGTKLDVKNDSGNVTDSPKEDEKISGSSEGNEEETAEDSSPDIENKVDDPLKADDGEKKANNDADGDPLKADDGKKVDNDADGDPLKADDEEKKVNNDADGDDGKSTVTSS
uniref:Methyltransferase domain-containing protein n=1 Tax=Panagrolaimus sp. JU765 TaxID=591449 RepID=A0AC34QID2_9BILA